jgi:hypothetical protein
MLDLVACIFSTIDLKCDVTLPNFTEPNKVVLGQEVEGFHVASGARTSKRGGTTL